MYANNSEIGYRNAIFVPERVVEILKNGHLPVKLHSSAPLGCTTVYYQIITQSVFNKSLNMLKTYPWEEPYEIFFSSCSERCDFSNGPRLYFENKGDHTRIWLALAEQ